MSLGAVDLCLIIQLSDKIVLIKAKITWFSQLNPLFSTQSKTILASARRAMAIFRANGIRTLSFGTTKQRSFCFVITKNSLLLKIQTKVNSPY